MSIRGYIKNFRKFLKWGGVVETHVSSLSFGNALVGKVVLITGGTSGFGFTIAKKLIQHGAKVIITGRSKDKMDLALKSLGSNNVEGIIWDVTDTALAPSVLEKANSIFGELDIAINNAGVWTSTNWSAVSEDEWDSIMDTNAKGLFFISQAEANLFLQSNKLHKIINITSAEGIIGCFHPYSASKWAANGLTKGMAKSLISKNIIVNAIAPGPAKTGINKEMLQDLRDNEFWPHVPNGRFVHVEEVANTAAFLCSDGANAIVGQVISIDGGMTL